MEPDILYAVRHGEVNAALRLSLRSLDNLPHRRVFIAGFCPSWVRGVTAVPTKRRANKLDSIEENVRAGLGHPEMLDDVVYMNDDFYITRPIEEVPVTHGGTVHEYKGQQEFKMRMRQTVRALSDELDPVPGFISNMLAYDGVHMPLPLERVPALKTITAIPQGCLWRTWYGNICAIGGEQVPNAKYKGTHPPPTELPTFLSTNAGGLKVLRERLEDILPRDCEYLS